MSQAHKPRRRFNRPETNSSIDPHRSKLIKLIEAQLDLENAVENIEDEDSWNATINAIDAGRSRINRAVDDFAQRPPATAPNQPQLTDKQRHSTRELRRVLQERIGTLDKSQGGMSTVSLPAVGTSVAAFAKSFGLIQAGEAEITRDWEPTKYRVLDPEADGEC